MAPDDVPAEEMHLFGSTRDPIDAALRGESDDPAVAAIVRDLRSAYLHEGALARSDALVAFAGAGRGAAPGPVVSRPSQPVEPVAPFGRRITVGLAAFAATITGKVVLGGAVAAAALGGLHAGEVIDVPLLPRAPEAHSEPSPVPEALDSSDPMSAPFGDPAQPPASAHAGDAEPGAPTAVLPAPISGADGPGTAPVSPSDADDADEAGHEPAPAPSRAAPTPDRTPRSAGPIEGPDDPSAAPQGHQPSAADPQAHSPGPTPDGGVPADRPTSESGEQGSRPRP